MAPRRRARPLLSRPFLLVAAFGSVLASFGLHEAAPAITFAYEQRVDSMHGRNTVAQRGMVGEEGALHDDIRRLSMGLDRAARSSASMGQLMPLDPQRIDMPKDLALFASEVERYAAMSHEEPSLRDDLVRHGYPAAVAAVAWLQQQDYEHALACSAACRVHALLAALTGVTGLEPEEPLADPDESIVRRFRAAALAWRRVLERHGRDPSEFTNLTAITRRSRPADKKD